METLHNNYYNLKFTWIKKKCPIVEKTGKQNTREEVLQDVANWGLDNLNHVNESGLPVTYRRMIK
jgi:hypothetical protein